MNEDRFWSMIEDAWQGSDGAPEARRKLVAGELSQENAINLSERSWIDMVAALKAVLETLPRNAAI